MGDILNGIFDIPRDARGRRISSRAGAGSAPQDIAEAIEIVVAAPALEEEPAALLGTFSAEQIMEAEFFDPSENTVAEVLAYAAEYPDQVPEIVRLEEQGKQRKSILALV